MTGKRLGGARGDAPDARRVRAWMECGVVAAVGAASSLLVVETVLLAIAGDGLPIVWQEVAALAVGNLVLAAWCLRRVRRGRCDPERRLLLAPVIGLCSVLVTAGAFAVVTGSLVGGLVAVLWVSMYTGYPVWAMIYAWLALWVLCRRAGHPRGHVRAVPGAQERGATP